MNSFDFLGVRQLPLDEPDPVAFDWKGDPLFAGEMVYSIDDQYVHEDDLLRYTQEKLGKPVPL
ncbi:hypothetical protein D922_04465 [Enterococcus faecalis 06-MB-DW-09]|nr:hypothetical protein D922_04465 [Enterococcus faecalis 06-MB-DW-09]